MIRLENRIPTRTIRDACFSFFHGNEAIPPKGIVVLCPGSNGDGRGWVDSDGWQDFAGRHNLSLVGVKMTDKDPTSIEGYCQAKRESGEALLWAVRDFSKTSGLPLDYLPLYVFGFSAGGQFAYELNNAFPERVKAFVVNKGGIYYTALQTALARQNYGLFIIGLKDETWRQDVVKGLYAVNRRGAAEWEILAEDVGHDIGSSEEISRGFFQSVIEKEAALEAVEEAEAAEKRLKR